MREGKISALVTASRRSADYLLSTPSAFYHLRAYRSDPSKTSARHQRNEELRPEIKQIWSENYQVYDVRMAWHQMTREGFELARGTVARLMKQIGIRGAGRGKVVKTTFLDTSAPCPRDQANRQFRARASNLLRGNDFTYVSTSKALSMWLLSSAHLRIASSAGSVGDSGDTALAEAINGLDKTELVYRQGQ